MKKEYVITIMLLVMLAACSAPTVMGWGCPDCGDLGDDCQPGVDTCYSGTVTNGTVHIEYANPPLPNPMKGWHNMTFDVPDGDIKWARVYWHIWGGNPGSDGWTNATLINGTASTQHDMEIPLISSGTCCNQTECCGWYMGGCGTHWVYWNVTDCITTGSNELCVDNTDWWDGRVMHMKLVVVLENMTDFPYPTTNYWINQGYWDLGLSNPTYTTWFNGSINSRNCTLWHLALASHKENITFNDQFVASYPDGTDEVAELILASMLEGDNTQNMTWDALGDDPHPVEAILVDNDYYFTADLMVEDKKIENFNNSCQIPTAFVTDHTYDVDALIRNRGGSASGAFNVSLYDGANRVDTLRVTNMASNERRWVRLQWQPNVHGARTLRVMADSDHEVNNELSETNNNITQSENVQQNGSSNADLYPEMRVLPAWRSNKTEIVVRMYNDGTTNASNFNVSARMTKGGVEVWNDSSSVQQTSVYAMAYQEITYTTDVDLVNCSDYTVTVVLDTDNDVSPEMDETNNATSKDFHAVDVRLKVTHHYGNSTTYNGQLSNNNDAEMFDVAKVIPNCTTPYDLLNSEADTTIGPYAAGAPYIYGINRSANKGTSTWYLNESMEETETCPSGRPIFWYCFIDSTPMPNMPDPMDEYVFSEPGEFMHIDLLKYVNSGSGTTSFRPRPIMDFPEPFKHGYNGTVNDTTIVYPSNDPGGDYAAIAGNIKNNLVNNCNIPGTRIHISTDTAVSASGRKNTDHLILIGTPQENSLIADANANHTEIGMPMYFMNRPNNAVWLIDDWLYNDDDLNIPDCCTRLNSSYHSVVMACDNPFPNAEPWTDTWMDADLTMWIASGVTDVYAKDAARRLVQGCDQPSWANKGFWYKNRTLVDDPAGKLGGCGDVSGDGAVSPVGDGFKVFAGQISTSEWAADVSGDGAVSPVSDGFKVFAGTFNCCCDCG